MCRLCLILAAVLMAGCAPAVGTGQNTALDAVDLTSMTDQMSSSILASPDVNAEFQSHGALKVVVQPVVNRMQGEVLPAGPADAFIARVRILLGHHAPEKFTWIANLDTFRRLRQQELQGVDLGPSPEAINPEYALTATFTSMAHVSADSRNDYYVCSYTLTNLKTRTLLWSGKYEVKKQAFRGFLD